MFLPKWKFCKEIQKNTKRKRDGIKTNSLSTTRDEHISTIVRIHLTIVSYRNIQNRLRNVILNSFVLRVQQHSDQLSKTYKK